jgi:hypothetical protein
MNELEGYATLGSIADRMGLTKECVRLWATGKRGPGGFPEPVFITDGRMRIWHWSAVEDWLKRMIVAVSGDGGRGPAAAPAIPPGQASSGSGGDRRSNT